ncbi:Gfo/Idh/MocA family protein [Agreia sp. COWG]|uniref:Gfo/Idh/MocA family protein n=1 Tax=Agreia sp. COWG TaxID=2773266 RepID=UPI0019262126|nr:Gfo/Idh/MocA family oxidoreductase [Agreia sp. COWG]CAD5990185.1 Predicted dehydrogenase [Agreia sp. COWG]
MSGSLHRPTYAPTGSGPVGVGIIGAGAISDQYLSNLITFPDVRVVMIGDLDVARAAVQAATYGVPRSGRADEVLADDDVEIVINLTIPAVHAELSSAALAAGKNVWSEKPISLDRESGQGLLDAAAASGLRIGVAPDTILGPGVQSALRAIARGDIGRPLTALTAFQGPGPESWHPNPDFFFVPGAGPLFDMGPYYLTTLACVFGSFSEVAAIGSRARDSRVIGSGPRQGIELPVSVSTQMSALARFEGGESSQSIFSFDSPLQRSGLVEITGETGTLVLPDPNMFEGSSVIVRGDERDELAEVGYAGGRGSAVLEMARAIRSGGDDLLPAQLGYHVLDVMTAMEESSASGHFVRVESSAPPSPALPEDWNPTTRTL